MYAHYVSQLSGFFVFGVPENEAELGPVCSTNDVSRARHFPQSLCEGSYELLAGVIFFMFRRGVDVVDR